MTMPSTAALDVFADSIRRIEQKLDRLGAAIQGDGELGTVGLKGRIERVELAMLQHDTDRKESSATLHKRVDQVERRLDRIQWTIAGWAAGGVIGGGGLVALLARLWT